VLKPVLFEQLPDEKLVYVARTDRQAMEVLILRYRDLVWSRVHQNKCGLEAEDLAQEGFLGLISAACCYDTSRGIPFAAYAARCVTNRIISAVRRCRDLSLPVGVPDTPPLSQVQDPAQSPDSEVQSRSVAIEMICAMVNRLSRREYQVCILIYSGASYAEVAKQLEISVKSVDNALQRARRKMRLETESAVV